MPQSQLADPEIELTLLEPDYHIIPSDRPGFIKIRLKSKANVFVRSDQDLTDEEVFDIEPGKTELVHDSYVEDRAQAAVRYDFIYLPIRQLVDTIYEGKADPLPGDTLQYSQTSNHSPGYASVADEKLITSVEIPGSEGDSTRMVIRARSYPFSAAYPSVIGFAPQIGPIATIGDLGHDPGSPPYSVGYSKAQDPPNTLFGLPIKMVNCPHPEEWLNGLGYGACRMP